MQNPSSYNEFLYNRQFMAGPRMFSQPKEWRHAKFGQRLFLSFHPSLQVTQVTLEDSELLCIGHIFDPANPSQDNEGVVKSLVERATTFKDFEEAIYALAGRWILFIRINDLARMYPDAGGTKSAYYTVGLPNGELWIGSQPMLIGDALGLPVDHERVEMFFRHNVKNTWVGEATPYNNIIQLLPNHYLHLDTKQTVRFYWSSRLPRYDLNTAVDKIREELFGILTALSARRPCALALTGGHDSRVLLACAGEARKKFQYFYISDPATPYHDISIPRKLSRLFNVPFRNIHVKPYTHEFREILRRNLGDMYWETGITKIFTFGEFDHRFFTVTGNMAELIRRCSYYRDGVTPLFITPALLAEKSGYGENPVALRAIAKWMAGAPKDSNINILDLFYWEHRIGNWISIALTGLDTVCEVIPAYNSRKVIELGLAVDNKYRTEPSYEIFRELCRRFAPEIAEISFNDCFRSRVVKKLEQVIPSRISEKWLWARMRLAGLDLYGVTIPAVSLLRQKPNGSVPAENYELGQSAGSREGHTLTKSPAPNSDVRSSGSTPPRRMF